MPGKVTSGSMTRQWICLLGPRAGNYHVNRESRLTLDILEPAALCNQSGQPLQGIVSLAFTLQSYGEVIRGWSVGVTNIFSSQNGSFLRYLYLETVLGGPRVVVLSRRTVIRMIDDQLTCPRIVQSWSVTHVYSAQACTLSASLGPTNDSIQAQAMSIPAETPEAVQNLLDTTQRPLGIHSTPNSAVSFCNISNGRFGNRSGAG